MGRLLVENMRRMADFDWQIRALLATNNWRLAAKKLERVLFFNSGELSSYDNNNYFFKYTEIKGRKKQELKNSSIRYTK